MIELNRLGPGTMGMSIVRNPETIHDALDAGITLFNTGEFGVIMKRSEVL